MIKVTIDGSDILLEGTKIGTIGADGSFNCLVVSAEFVARKLDGQEGLPPGAVLFLEKWGPGRLRRAA